MESSEPRARPGQAEHRVSPLGEDTTWFGRAKLLFQHGPEDDEAGRSRARYRRAFWSAVSSFGARAVNLLVSLVTVPLTLRYLGPERYGLWMVITSLIAVMGFADLGIGNGLLNAVAEADGKQDRTLATRSVSSAFFVLTGLALLLGAIAAVASPLVDWTRVFNVRSAAVAGEGRAAMGVLFAWFLVNIPLGVVQRILAGLQRTYQSQVMAAAGSLVSLVAVLGVIRMQAGLPLLVFASTIGSIVALLANGWVLVRTHPWLLPKLSAFQWHTAMQLLGTGGLFFVLQLSWSIGVSSDNIVIAQVLGASAVASYSVPQKLFTYVTMALLFGIVPLWPAYTEAMARGDADWVKRTLRRSLWLTFLFSTSLNVVLVVAAPLLLRHWTGGSATLLLRVSLAAWGIVGTLSSAVSMFLNAAGTAAMRYQAGSAVVMAALNIAISIFLTRRIGTPGVAVGSALSQFIILLPTLLLLPVFLRSRGTPARDVTVASC